MNLTRIRWAASILLIFFIVIATNLIDRENFSRLSYSVKTIYEDRIVASDLLFEMSMLVNEKQIVIVTKDSLSFEGRSEHANRSLVDLMTRYEQTKLAEREKVVFSRFKEELIKLKQAEEVYFSSDQTETTSLIKSIGRITEHLYALSKIQIEEGKRQVGISNRAMDKINLLTKGEIIFLVIIAVLVQILILYRPKKTEEPEDA